jgi:hypothetical protein
LERKGGIGLGVLERTLLFMLPLVCNELGCARMDLRAIRSRIFPEAGVWLFMLRKALKSLERRKLVSLFMAHGGGMHIHLDFMKEFLPETVEVMPNAPLPPWIDCVKTDDGSFKVIHFDK